MHPADANANKDNINHQIDDDDQLNQAIAFFQAVSQPDQAGFHRQYSAYGVNQAIQESEKVPDTHVGGWQQIGAVFRAVKAFAQHRVEKGSR